MHVEARNNWVKFGKSVFKLVLKSTIQKAKYTNKFAKLECGYTVYLVLVN